MCCTEADIDWDRRGYIVDYEHLDKFFKLMYKLDFIFYLFGLINVWGGGNITKSLLYNVIVN